MAADKKDTIKQIYDLLPKLNCGFCGFGNCGQFAKAVSEGRASPFGCRQNPWVGYNINHIMGKKVPIFRYHYRFGQPAFGQRPGGLASIGSLSAEVEQLSKRTQRILDRINSLEGKIRKREPKYY
jgi:Na+-translocating ferredoxin:NAD+ oxidoreductase RNF subunit RnfB